MCTIFSKRYRKFEWYLPIRILSLCCPPSLFSCINSQDKKQIKRRKSCNSLEKLIVMYKIDHSVLYFIVSCAIFQHAAIMIYLLFLILFTVHIFFLFLIFFYHLLKSIGIPHQFLLTRGSNLNYINSMEINVEM